MLTEKSTAENTGAKKYNGSRGNVREKRKENASLESKVRQTRERAQNTVLLGIEKAVAHYENPAMYPLPAGNKSVERAFYDLIILLPKSKRNKIVDKVNETLKADKIIRQGIYKDIVNVNFKSALPIVEQVKTLPVPPALNFTKDETYELHEEFKRKAEKPKKNGYAAASAPQQAVAATKVALFIDNMTCLNPDDVLKDEVNLAGFAIDTAGNSSVLAPFFVGKFRKNETVLLNGNSRLFTLAIDPNVDAQNFLAGLFIIESDLTGNTELVQKLSVLFAVIGITLMFAGLGLLIAAAAGAGFSVNALLITWITGGAFSIVGHYLPLIGDDISLAVTDTLSFVGKQDAGLVFDRSLTIGKGFDAAITFDGKYTASARWVTEV